MPGVGQNLQDHLEIYVQQACTQPITLYDKSSWRFPHNMIRIGLQWFLTKTGEGASSHLESGGFVRSRPEVEHPDLQFHFLPSTVHDHGRKAGDRHAYQVIIILLVCSQVQTSLITQFFRLYSTYILYIFSWLV